MVRPLASPWKSTKQTLLAAIRPHSSDTEVFSSEYMQRSVVPTMHYQKSLPRLKIPKLAHSVQKYLTAQRPLLDDDKFRNTERIAQGFLNGPGKRLQEELVAWDKLNKHKSYITDAWNDDHLCQKSSLLMFNPYTFFKPDPRTKYNDQLVKTTNILCSTVRFVKTLRAGLLEPDVLHRNPAKSDTERFKRFIRWVPSSLSCYVANMVEAYPLDMSQYSRMFNSTRIPKRGRDELFTDDKGRHVLVMRKGNMYVFDVVDRDGNLVKPAEIQSHLKYILSEAAPVPDFPLGVLTSENRDVWADLRDKLEAAGNAENLRSVDSALFCLCLDDTSMRSGVPISHNMLHGDGCNRWFDKSFSVIVTKDGQAAINFEHSWGDGVAVIRFLDEVVRDTVEQPLVHPGSAAAAEVDSASSVRRLDFNLDSELKDGINKAKEKFHTSGGKFTCELMHFRRAGKGQIKMSKFSPDAMVQLALQMAYLREYGRMASISEISSSLRLRYGRLEVMYTATVHTQRCSQAFVCQPGQHSVGQLQAMLRDCSTCHRQLIEEASVGRGFYCHLMALCHLAGSKGHELPHLFTDPNCAALGSPDLTTSTVSGLYNGDTICAPDTVEGINVTYLFSERQISFAISRSPGSSHTFVQCLQRSLEDIFNVLEGKLPS
ncbi:carnitine O-palmitoyltransferase 2, mitochondrial-like [Nelusetta ayraudi]|uniref:carnitine O-palmitoyltransferase 2, mitochondrial-like n=1 Tax=Nelusetta ayraudi TaxID=303726 RepID=UPI003F7038B1